MKGAVELREAIALTIAEVPDPPPAPPILSGQGTATACTQAFVFCSLSAMWHPTPHLSHILRWPEAKAYTFPLSCLLPVLQTNNELEAQRVATEFAFRKRLREMEKVYSELKWQEKNVSFSAYLLGPGLPAVG